MYYKAILLAILLGLSGVVCLGVGLFVSKKELFIVGEIVLIIAVICLIAIIFEIQKIVDKWKKK